MLHVRTASGEEVAALSGDNFQTVLDLKRHLRTLHGYPVSLQKLVFDGRLLDDDDVAVPEVGEMQLILLAEVSEEVDSDAWHTAGHELVAYAGRFGHLESARFLLQAGVDKDYYCDFEDAAALTVAARHGHTEMVRLLADAGSSFKEAGLLAAATGGHPEIVRFLLDADACEDDIALTRHALQVAVYFGHAEVVPLLVEAGAKQDWQDCQGRTALMHAVASGHTEIARCLVDTGANKDLRNSAGVTALMLAAVYGHTEIARLLVEAGADTEVVDSQGRTALEHARLRKRRSHAKIAAFLQEVTPSASGTKAKRPRLSPRL
ncbi:mask [Symbiodinium sp. CCMP2456]|nr:mask [Symbiodinium sp. CCMP2456]